MTTYVIGIDGGGTSTEALLVDADGNVIANATGGPTNPNTVSEADLTAMFQAIFKQLEQQFPESLEQVTRIFAGISGAGSETMQEYLQKVISPFAPNSEIDIYPDTINALYSGTLGEPGIVQICGTGSITYGVNQFARHDRVGGWGYLLGDEGSGYDIGRKGIKAVLHYLDGIGPKTQLCELLYEYFQVTNGRHLIEKIYQSPSPKTVIAPIAKKVFIAYSNGDLVAKNIVHHVAQEISRNILTLYQKLFTENERVKIVLCGGVFSNRTILPTLLKEEIANSNEQLLMVLPKLSPVYGSVIGALKESSMDLSEKVVVKWDRC